MSEPAAEQEMTEDEAILAALEEHMAEDKTEDEESPPEAEEEQAPDEDPQPEASDEDQPEVEAEEEEELLEPHHHWPHEVQDIFRTMNRAQQDAWLERERNVQAGLQKRSEEYGGYKRTSEEIQEMVAPNVEDWARQGLTPTMGVMRAMALEKALRENPAEALLGLARERGIDLEQVYSDQPYVDAATRAANERVDRLESYLRQIEAQRETEAQHQQQQSAQALEQSIYDFQNTPDGNGGLKYPHARDNFVMQAMAQAVEAGEAHDMPTAYDAALARLGQSSFFQSQVGQSVDANAAKVQKAVKAAEVVTGDVDEKPPVYNEDAAIMKMLEDGGMTEP